MDEESDMPAVFPRSLGMWMAELGFELSLLTPGPACIAYLDHRAPPVGPSQCAIKTSLPIRAILENMVDKTNWNKMWW